MTRDRTLLDANRLWVDARLRAAAQRRVETPVLRALAGPLPPGARALELGCGRRGTGVRLALDAFGAARVDAVDLHPASVVATRLATRDLGERVQVDVGDARALGAADGTYDLVLAFHVLHHTPGWRDVVAEAARVLRPGGRFLSAEMTARFVDSPVLRAVSRHPDDGDRPTPEGVEAAARAAGLRVDGQRTRYLGCWTALAATRP